MTRDAQRIEDLRREIERYNRLYYVEAESEVSDHEYDRLLKELKDLEAGHPELVTPDSPTQRVGGTPLPAFETVPHTVPMYSIDNTYDRSELMAWHQRVIKGLGKQNGLFDTDGNDVEYVVEPKIDGVAVSLTYERGHLTLALSRGDGRHGDNITQNIRTIRAVPLELDAERHAPPDILEIRGEVFMPDDEFVRINHARTAEGTEPFANPRNATAGTLKQRDPRTVTERRLRFFGHGTGRIDPDYFETQYRLLEAMRTFAIPVIPHTRICTGIEAVWQHIESFENERDAVGFATDGMVIKINRRDWQKKLGHTSKAPRWSIACKYAAEQAVTRLLQVDWQVGKTGKLTPRATMEPVFLAGTTVRHATLHNADEIVRKDIRIDDIIMVEKAGEIIPQVVTVLTEKRPKNTSPIQPPHSCPSCTGPVVRDEDEVAHRCVNPECPAQIRESLIWFAARGQMDIEGLGEKMVHQLVDVSALRSFGDIYTLHERREQLTQLERMGERKVDNLLGAIEESKRQGLQRVLTGLGIRHVGARAAQIITDHFESMAELLKASREDIETFEVGGKKSGIGPETAESLHEFLQSDTGRHIIEQLTIAEVDLTSPRAERPDPTEMPSPFTGKTIVITGTLEGIGRKELAEKLEALGAKITASISKKTDLLIAGENPGSKWNKAKELGVDIWDQKKLGQTMP